MLEVFKSGRKHKFVEVMEECRRGEGKKEGQQRKMYRTIKTIKNNK